MMYEVKLRRNPELFIQHRYVVDAHEPMKAVAVAIERWLLENGIGIIEGAPVPFEMFTWTIKEID